MGNETSTVLLAPSATLTSPGDCQHKLISRVSDPDSTRIYLHCATDCRMILGVYDPVRREATRRLAG